MNDPQPDTLARLPSRAERIEAERLAYRAQRRMPTRNAAACSELKRAALLPAPNADGLTADERRALRNRMKAARRSVSR